jgi:O-glycosyl hydrolase
VAGYQGHWSVMSVAVPATQYDAHGKPIWVTEIYVNRSTHRGRPTGDVSLFVTVGSCTIQLSISAVNWNQLNQAVGGMTNERQEHRSSYCCRCSRAGWGSMRGIV